MKSVAVAPEIHAVPTSDGTEVRLTRYRFGDKGPLVLAPGYGNAARAFTVDTVPKNWVQYLGEHGWDVWLFDYRASPDLPSSYTQFTVDDIALRDWPAAVGGRAPRDPDRQRPGDGPLHRRADAVHGARRRAGGRARGDDLRGRRPSGPDARQPAAGVGAGPDDHEGARDQELHQRLRPALLERPDRRGADADRPVPAHLRQPGRAPDLLHVRRRLPVREHQPRDDGAGGAGLLRQQQHDVLRAHGRDGPGRPRARRPRRATRTWRTSTRSSSRSSS